jgi:hypothetical protein
MSVTKPCCPPAVPPMYPYNRPARDSYTFCVCGKNPCTPSGDLRYPAGGPFVGSAFAMYNTMPYLIDSTTMNYGQVLNYANTIETTVTQRNDPSCINLAASFNITDNVLTNTVRMDFLKKYISRKYEELSGVLPILKGDLRFKVYYTVKDQYGGITHTGTCEAFANSTNFHFTDVKDVYVQSAKCLIIENIPAMTYQGLYTFILDRIEVYAKVINTKDHMIDAMNPFYVFTDNNTKIALQHETIDSMAPDDEIMISACDINRAFEYCANVTNRVRLSFVAFTSIPIACGDTSGVYESLNEPTEQIINQLRLEVSDLYEEVAQLRDMILAQNTKIATLEGQVELNKNNITTNTSNITTLQSITSAHASTLEDHERRITALEGIPLAVIWYRAGFEFVRGQLTYLNPGVLYQATQTFTASGNLTDDINEGKLVPIVINEK